LLGETLEWEQPVGSAIALIGLACVIYGRFLEQKKQKGVLKVELMGWCAVVVTGDNRVHCRTHRASWRERDLDYGDDHANEQSVALGR
jgi:hypothetical protein